MNREATRMDMASNRRAVKYTPRQQAMRMLWAFGRVVFRMIPRPFFGARAALLRLFGARLGSHVHVYPSATIVMPWNLEAGDWSSIGEHVFIYNLAPVRIGREASVSLRAHLCAGSHDPEDPAMSLVRRPIVIGDQAWVCADAFVGPGVTVGEGAVVGARGVAMRDVAAWTIVAGNPAVFVKERRLKEPTGA